jgi:Na+/H+-dicarboxylate symporter
MTTAQLQPTSPNKNNLTQRIVIGMVAGILLGTFLQWLMPNGSDKVVNLYLFELSIKGFFCRWHT